MSFHTVLGHDQAKNIIQRALENSSVSHAYLFYGPESIGKRRTAWEFAKALNCHALTEEGACDTCPACTKIEQGLHPDVFYLEPVKPTPSSREAIIKIDAVRDLQKKLGYLPYEGRTKVCIVDGVEKMNPQACNAFLKTLEEPPSSTVMICISGNPYQLLPTMVSRCQGVKFNPLPAAAIKKILFNMSETEDMDPAEVQLRVLRSQGQVAAALDEDITLAARYRDELLGLIDRVSLDRMDLVFQWSKSVSGSADNIQAVLEEILGLLRDIAYLRSGGNRDHLLNKDMATPLLAVAHKHSLNSILGKMDAVLQTQNALRFNANTQLTLDNMLIQFCEAA